MQPDAPLILTDAFGRRHDYLRISITERCNLRCRYCMPAEGIPLTPKLHLLSFEEIERLAVMFVALGVRKIRLTGGEPLVRTGVEELCAALSGIAGLSTLALSTNGVLLQQKARQLREAGVSQINISLDTLAPEKFKRITLRDNLDSVLEGIRIATRAGFDSVKINCVMIRGFNDDEIVDFVELANALGVHVRFIEFMPFSGNGWSMESLISCREIREVIETRYALDPVEAIDEVRGPAMEFLVRGGGGSVGFIATITEPCCHSCSRLRITADGEFRTCLFARGEVDLRSLLRQGEGPDALKFAIGEAVRGKWGQRPNPLELSRLRDRAMVAIGG